MPRDRTGMSTEAWRQTVNAGIALGALCAIVGLLALVWRNRFDRVLSDLVVSNFAAIIGLPFAFIGGFVVIALFRQAETPLAFDGLGLHLTGAAGEIVLWVLCYAVISGSIALLWRK